VFHADIAAGKALPFGVDVTDEAAISRAVAEGVAEWGRFDGLVCTVGGYKGGVTTVDSSWADWQAMLDTNVKATVMCTRAALPPLIERSSGSIVHVASLAALAGAAGQAAYASAKAAVLRFTESVADEVKASGVRVNAVLPGTLDTPQNRSWMGPEQVASAIDPRAVAEAIAFLLSDAARAVTGAGLRVTGRQ
jgi:NAD(P)-dependent dehydrogenase (short-subunit alcohol dehydrogenase family)